MSTQQKVVVAVHGIGDQIAFETVQAVVKQFCKYNNLPATVSLGRLDSDIRSNRGALALMPPFDPDLPLNVSFTEVHWADIAREVENKGYRLEDARHWARTIIERMKLRRQNDRQIAAKDYDLIKLVLQEAINAITVSELFMTVFKHAGAYKPKLQNVLTNYLGDVQLVTEFRVIREMILAQFEKAMETIHCAANNADIYIIAHSEGTVISFLGLLQALKKKADHEGSETPAGPEASKASLWIDNVKGFITIGSPIDKHLALWPELWDGLNFTGKDLGNNHILWHNYYDFGDPVGFKLETAREWLNKVGCTSFDFPQSNDFGFSRSYLPGKAHVDYWTDTELFGHIINTVIAPQSRNKAAGTARTKEGVPRLLNDDQPKKKPGSRLGAKISNCILPYLMSFLPLFAGIFFLYRTVDIAMNYNETGRDVIVNSLLIALLLAGITVFSRVVRLSRRWTNQIVAALFYFATTRLFLKFMSEEAKNNICDGLTYLLRIDNPDLALFAASALIAGLGLFSRKYSLKPLLIPGFAVVSWVIGTILLSDKRIALTPVLTTTVAFFCLWWLSAIIFDLSFIWHAYIRNNRVADKLYEQACVTLFDNEKAAEEEIVKRSLQPEG